MLAPLGRLAAPLLPASGASPQQPQAFKLYKQLWKDYMKPVVLKLYRVHRKCEEGLLKTQNAGLPPPGINS